METELMLMVALAVSACANILFCHRLLQVLLPQWGYRNLPKTPWGLAALAFAHAWKARHRRGAPKTASP